MTFFDLIGLPYAEGGRGPAEYDCAGLAVEMQRRQCRPVAEIPPTPVGNETLQALSIMRILRTRWRRTSQPVGALVFFVDDAHVGTMIDLRRFIHASEEPGYICIESLDSPRWKRRSYLFYVPESAD